MTQPYSDHVLPVKRALRLGANSLVVITVLSLLGWGVARGLPGVYGVALGALLSGGFLLLTTVAVKMTAHLEPAIMIAVILGGTLVKLALLFAALRVIREMNFYDAQAMGVTLVLATIAVLFSEMWGVASTKTTFLD